MPTNLDPEDSFEVESVLLNEDVLIFGGGVLPHIAMPDAPLGSFYFRNTGDVFVKKTVGILIGNWEEKVSGGGGGTNTGIIPFINSNGTSDDLDLVVGNLPFLNSNGTSDDIAVI